MYLGMYVHDTWIMKRHKRPQSMNAVIDREHENLKQ